MTWRREEKLVWEELDDGMLLVNPETGSRWALNSTAAAIWKLSDGACSATEMAAALRRSRHEVANFCTTFARLGLLRPIRSFARGRIVPIVSACHLSAPSYTALGLGTGPRRRPSPSGISGPA